MSKLPHVPSPPRPAPPVITPFPVPPATPPLPRPQFQTSQYSGIGSMPFNPVSAARPVAPPFAPGAFMRPAPPPMPVTQLPAGLAGPIFPQKGWHFGPPVSMNVPVGYNTDCLQDFPPTAHIIGGYGAEDEDKKGEPSKDAKIGIAVVGVLALGSAVMSSIVFGRRYGGPGYIIGFSVPALIGAAVGALGRVGQKK